MLDHGARGFAHEAAAPAILRQPIAKLGFERARFITDHAYQRLITTSRHEGKNGGARRQIPRIVEKGLGIIKVIGPGHAGKILGNRGIVDRRSKHTQIALQQGAKHEARGG